MLKHFDADQGKNQRVERSVKQATSASARCQQILAPRGVLARSHGTKVGKKSGGDVD
jgi:hypothetical protein